MQIVGFLLVHIISFFQIMDTVKQSDSLSWCIDRCKTYGHRAINAIDIFPASDAKQALTNIANATTNIQPGKL